MTTEIVGYFSGCIGTSMPRVELRLDKKLQKPLRLVIPIPSRYVGVWPRELQRS